MAFFATFLETWSTVQTPEQIILNGDTLALYSVPLEERNGPIPDSMLSNPKTPRFFGNSMNTACWRGYVGYWKISGNKLYLSAIRSCNERKFADLKKHFQIDSAGMVFAEWFSGRLRIPTGNSIGDAPLGFGLHETEYRVLVLRGKVWEVEENKIRRIELKEIRKIEKSKNQKSLTEELKELEDVR